MSMVEAGGPARNKNGARYSRICFTINNWTAPEYEALLTNSWKWMVVGKEVGQDGTPHLQGAAILGGQMALSAIKKLPGMARAHIEPMMGTPVQNMDYCTKQDPAAYTKGVLLDEGKRQEVYEAGEALKAGATMRQLAEEHTTVCIKYTRGLIQTRALLVNRRTTAPKVIWLFGKTGVGKTKCCRDFADKYNGGDCWMSAGDLKWFDGYDGQRVAICDDFRGKHCSFSFLLRLLDRYPFRVPIKGAFVEWTPDVIFITSPYPPEEIFAVRGEHLPEDMNQLKRRITKVIELKDADVYLGDAGGSGSCKVLECIRRSVQGEAPPGSPPIRAPPNPLQEVISLLSDDEQESMEDSADLSMESWMTYHTNVLNNK